jgi:galactitol-specific phosphotransferase system IIB component
MARVVALATDLMLASKVEAMLTASGHEVTLTPSLQEGGWDGVDLIVADLDTENPEALVGLGMPVLGYYSHVNVETREAAEAAGVDLVVPRSRLARELPQLAERLLSEPA